MVYTKERVMDSVVIAVIEGTVRGERRSMAAAEFVASVGRQVEGVEIVFVDPRETSLTGDGYDSKDAGFADVVARADGFFIVTPEYNHSFPGTLKRLLDSEYDNYNRKAVALAGVSDGDWGGTRAVEGLLPTLRTLGLFPTQYSVYFPRVQDIFGDNGQIMPEFSEKYQKRVRSAFDQLVWTARALRWGREHLDA